MSRPSSTLRALLDLGFEQKPDEFGMPTVGYKFETFELKVTDSISIFYMPTVSLTGIIKTDRIMQMVNSEIPNCLETPEEAAAWITYALRFERSHLQPLPKWWLNGEMDWDLVPAVRRQRLYQSRPRCTIDRDYARIWRRTLQCEIVDLKGSAELRFQFDGEVLVSHLDSARQAVVASGNAWQRPIAMLCTSDLTLPRRFMTPTVEVSFFDGRLTIGPNVYPAMELDP